MDVSASSLHLNQLEEEAGAVVAAVAPAPDAADAPALERSDAGADADADADPPKRPRHLGTRRQVLAAVVAASFHLAVGVALAFSAVLIPQIEAPGSDIQVTPADSSWLASALVLVVPVGALLAGGAMEWLGRLNTVAAAALPCAAGWVLIATAPDVTSILIGRLLTGVAAGLGTSAGVVYITEVAKPELRGSLISICPSLASLGMLIVYGEGAVVGWRAAAWSSLAYVLLPVLPVLLWLPESPSWLVAKGRTEDAERALAWLTGKQASAVKEQASATATWWWPSAAADDRLWPLPNALSPRPHLRAVRGRARRAHLPLQLPRHGGGRVRLQMTASGPPERPRASTPFPCCALRRRKNSSIS